MDVSNYEYVRHLWIKNELKKKKSNKKFVIYHIIDLIILIATFCGCYRFNIYYSYQNENGNFYSFCNTLIDMIILGCIRIGYTTLSVIVNSKIYDLQALKKMHKFGNNLIGIFIIIMCLKIINFNYFMDINKNQNDLNDLYVIIFRVVLITYNLISTIYYYFFHRYVYIINKKNIVAKIELKKILLKGMENNENIILGIHCDKSMLKYNSILSQNNEMNTTCSNNDIDLNNENKQLENNRKRQDISIDNDMPYTKLNDYDDLSKNIENKKSQKKMREKTISIDELEIDKSIKDDLVKNNIKLSISSHYSYKQNNNKIKKKSKDDNSSTSFDETNDSETESSKNIAFLENSFEYSEFKNILLPYLWPSRRIDLKGNSLILRTYVLLIFILIIVSKVFSVVSPIYLGLASTEVLNKNYHNSLYYLGIYSSFFFFSKFLKEISGVLYSHVKQSAFIELQESIFHKFHNLSYEWFSNKNAGGIMRIVDRGTESTNNLMNSFIVYIIPAVIEGVVTCIIFIFKYKNRLLGSILILGLIIYIYATIKITKWRKKIRTKVNKMDNLYHGIAHDSLENYENVKYFNNENFEIKKFCGALSNFNRYNIKILNSLGMLNIVQQFVLNGTLFFTLLCAIHMIIYDGEDSGIFISVIVYISNVFAPLTILGTLYFTIVKSYTDIYDLTEALKDKIPVTDDKDLESFSLTSHEKKFGVHIEFSDVNFSYPKQTNHRTLKSISFFIPAGTTCALVGHTGSGKSTIAKLLYRFYDAEGDIKIGGRNINKYNRNSIRSIIGIVPQDTILFNETIKYNILYGKLDATDDEVIKATKSAQLYDFIEALPKKWDTIVGNKGVKLSGGERQRIAIARCLLKDPKIVIFDEATSSLDSKTEYLFQKAVEDLRKNRTLIIIAHRLSTISSAESIILLNKGKIVEKGTHKDLIKLNGEYAEMWNMQSGNNDI
ncbi:multidrug resistance protein 2, putative [Plasmodium berghei]|uniref:Multidrug resistance protein 2, putative n=2 Tax=Plasmodium berghei TaxID=5821 RepID=A0A509APK4_PLABA|nr:ABC transporter B family member 2, putative [Plasmodium berghei ANKA]CXI90467.1 multidrug resistance protein 2, putative [Plasmodium berghei]SCL96252.1 multidrug resistance protein 2, putative [Plasmodium berghei]SCM16392.1 multidrug resistance protein 2, putative [Plasmodium berghei]SCM18186.1 multidrug resistance protein 2, putative [Plasmodium berghei]SCN27613.1 multidrug resistance protein 2, putative [Plasmodium berghei]|eukprot:XP_034423269.1 ABC transporter B family member 2, putative [Plasmodium berghei ANKA]